jgi:thioredoxin 2
MSFSHITSCPSCGKGNRIPAAHLADSGKCGACKAPLSPVHEPIAADQTSFEEIIAGAKVPVLVDFWAEWCGPCRAIAPELRALAQEMSGHALVLKVDTEAEPMLAERFRVQSIPFLMVFQNGRPVAQRAGAAGRAELRRWLEAAARAN